MMDRSTPLWRQRWFWLLLLLLAVGAWAVWHWLGGSASDRTLEKTALSFLGSADAGDFESCRKQTGIEDRRFAMFKANRESLGALKERRLVRREPLRFNNRTGWLFYFSSQFENARIREIIAVLTEADKPVEIFSVRYEYERLPRPTPTAHYSGLDAAAVRQQAQRAALAYDRGEWKFFEAIGRRDVGYERRGAGKALAKVQEKFGKVINRSTAAELRYVESLPGCINLSVIRVLNRTSYQVKNQVFTADEYVYLVLDRAAEKPEWAVYGFTPGTPRRIRVR